MEDRLKNSRIALYFIKTELEFLSDVAEHTAQVAKDLSTVLKSIEEDKSKGK